MYIIPLYGKEWNWRNVKMEAREELIIYCYKGHNMGSIVYKQ